MRTWNEQKEIICKDIKLVSDFYGGDEVNELRDYAKILIKTYREDLADLEFCFGLLKKQTKYIKMS